MPIKTIILRFRDLVTEPSETLTIHRKLIVDKKYVIWGWWSKEGEQIPEKEFSALAAVAEKKGLRVYLFDTGRLQVYKAKCVKIYYDHAKNKISSPEIDYTPEYYKNQKYLAWFKLTEIEETKVEENELNNLAYIEVSDFFDGEGFNFNIFNDKIVSSLQELRLQERTIWFVRDAITSDHRHEIRLTDSNRITPSHFVKEFVATQSKSILWVSDLHFGSFHAFHQEHKISLQKSFLWEAIKDRCDKLGKNDFAGVIVSGDISTKGGEEGFKKAQEHFFQKISSIYKLKNYDWIICPGNHDFKFSTEGIPAGEEQILHLEEFTRHYSDLYKSLFYIQPNEYFSSGRRFLVNNTYPVEIIALNSQTLQQNIPDVFQGYGYVGKKQLQDAETHYKWSEKKNSASDSPIRIAVMHHHLLPVSYTESLNAGAKFSISLDAEAITRWMLENNVKLILHGHMHQPSIVTIKRPVEIRDKTSDQNSWKELTICSLGSSGVILSELGELKENTFGVISFEEKHLKLEVFEISPVVEKKTDHPVFSVKIPI